MNITLNAPINFTSYGILSLNILRELSQRHKVSLFPIGQIEAEQEDFPLLREVIENANTFDYKATCIRIFHQFSLHEMPRCGKRVGFPIFELDKFNSKELHSMNSCDELVVCSEWGKQICRENGIEMPIHVAPLGVESIEPEEITGDKFIVTNAAKFEIRKGHDILPEIFRLAFNNSNNNVKLRMLANNQFFTEEQNREWRDYYVSLLGDKVEFVDRLSSRKEVIKFINSGHVGLYPTRAEGFNMSALETLACGKYVIASDYSGQTEFLNEDNSFLVKPSGMEVAHDGHFFTSGIGEWASFNQQSINSFVEHLRFLYSQWVWGNYTLNKNGIKTAQKFSWKNTVDKLEECL